MREARQLPSSIRPVSFCTGRRSSSTPRRVSEKQQCRKIQVFPPAQPGLQLKALEDGDSEEESRSAAALPCPPPRSPGWSCSRSQGSDPLAVPNSAGQEDSWEPPKTKKKKKIQKIKIKFTGKTSSETGPFGSSPGQLGWVAATEGPSLRALERAVRGSRDGPHPGLRSRGGKSAVLRFSGPGEAGSCYLPVSWSKLCRWISVAFCGRWTLCIQEWLKMSSKDGLSEGRRDKHHLMRCWHSAGEKTTTGGCQLLSSSSELCPKPSTTFGRAACHQIPPPPGWCHLPTACPRSPVPTWRDPLPEVHLAL